MARGLRHTRRTALNASSNSSAQRDARQEPHADDLIPSQKIDTFLRAFHSKLPSNVKVVMIDNAYAEGSSTPISRKDTYGNTYQIRRLEDGSEHEVLKNFPSSSDLCAKLQLVADGLTLTHLEYYWIAEYRTKELPSQG